MREEKTANLKNALYREFELKHAPLHGNQLKEQISSSADY